MGMVVGSPFLAVVTISLMPRFTQDASYLAMTEFLSMGSDNFGPDEFRQVPFRELTWWASGGSVDVSFLLGIMLSCTDE